MIGNEIQIRHKVAIALFNHYKDWINEDIVTPEQLALRIDLSGIMFWDSGQGHLFYRANGDDYMFTDHVVTVWLDANGEIEEVGLEG